MVPLHCLLLFWLKDLDFNRAPFRLPFGSTACHGNSPEIRPLAHWKATASSKVRKPNNGTLAVAV